jgi:hypothetical protein
MMAEYKTREDLLAIVEEAENLRVLCRKLTAETDELTRQLEYARDKLKEAQERNRKLDWLLTKAVERL